MLQAAVSYELQVIGEAAGRLGDPFRAGFPAVPWDKIVKVRHRLVHDYYAIDPPVVWNVATIHLPELVRELSKRATPT